MRWRCACRRPSRGLPNGLAAPWVSTWRRRPLTLRPRVGLLPCNLLDVLLRLGLRRGLDPASPSADGSVISGFVERRRQSVGADPSDGLGHRLPDLFRWQIGGARPRSGRGAPSEIAATGRSAAGCGDSPTAAPERERRGQHAVRDERQESTTRPDLVGLAAISLARIRVTASMSARPAPHVRPRQHLFHRHGEPGRPSLTPASLQLVDHVDGDVVVK